MTSYLLPSLLILLVLVGGTWLSRLIERRTGRSSSQPFALYGIVVIAAGLFVSDQIKPLAWSLPWKLAASSSLVVALVLLAQVTFGSRADA